MKTLSVVVPVYYNEGSLAPLFDALQQVERALLERQVRLELIFVDDGSGDHSFEHLLAIKARRPDTKLIRLIRNFGAVQASKTGVRHATGDCFMVLAADLQDPPELIVTMVEKWLAGSKFVICVRQSRRDPLLTRLFAWSYYRILRAFVVSDYPEGGYDLALMDRVMLPHMQKSSKNINPNVLAFWLGFQPERLEYERRERTHGKSRWTLTKKLKFFLDTLVGFSFLPLRLMLFVGMGVSFFSFLLGAFFVMNALLDRYEVPGFASLAVLLTFLQGILISMLGIVGEYIWRILDEVTPRPEAVIAEVL